MTDKLTKITMYKGESYPIEADFRAKAKKIGATLTGATHSAASSIITVGSSSVTANVVTVVVTANTVGCTVLTTTATSADPYSLIGKVEIEVINPTECS